MVVSSSQAESSTAVRSQLEVTLTCAGYTNLGSTGSGSQSNPTTVIWPDSPEQQNSALLQRSGPTNLFPIMYLLPDGQVFINAGYEVVTLDPTTRAETALQSKCTVTSHLR